MISPQIMAILNITPDSFSDGGKYNNIDAALAKTDLLIKENADIIDIGAASTRPSAVPISDVEEWERIKIILPEFIKLVKKSNKLTSIDTYHSSIAIKAIDMGIDIVNDVSNSVELQQIAVSNDVKIVVMHNLSVPADNNIILDSKINIIEFMKDFIYRKMDYLIRIGAKHENLIFDPGIGFGKSPIHSFEIIKEISQLTEMNIDLLVGHSRKSFYKIIDKTTDSRDIETHITSIYLTKNNVKYLRVHDIRGTSIALKLYNLLN